MTKRIGMFAALAAMVFSGVVNAEMTIAGGMKFGDGDAKAGKSKSEMCQGCHGADGISIDPTAFPNLAGQFAGYIYKQVRDFQLGNRSDDTMSAMASMVTSKQDLKDIAVYFATQKPMKASGSKNKTGAKIYKSGNKMAGDYAACARCHGVDGKGRGKKAAGPKKPGSKVKKNPLFPVIGGQQKAYLIKQLKDFKEGKRANDPAGMMALVAKGLSDKEIEAVAEYVSSL